MSKHEKNQNIFISYAHTNEEHKTRVREIATELMDKGFDVILDVWSFKKGEDLNKKMEEYADTSDNILIIGDKNYVDKANNRESGVGKESVILTDSYMRKSSKNQNNIYYAFTEIDEEGQPVMPRYLKGNFAFDFTDKIRDIEKCEEIARTLYDEPLIPKPKIGKKPDFANIVSLRSAKRIERSEEISKRLLDEYIEDLKIELDEIDKYFLNHDINTKPDFTKLESLLKTWGNVVKKMSKPDDVSKIIESLLQTIDDFSSKSKDGTKIFTRIAFVYTVAYAIDKEDFNYMENLFKYDYFYENRDVEFQVISMLCNPRFIHEESYKFGKFYSSRYLEVQDIIVRDNEYNIANVFEADIFIQFVCEMLGYDNWYVLDSDIYSRANKFSPDLKFIKSLKREKKVKQLFSILNLNDMKEFKEKIENLNYIKLFSVIEKEKIALVK